MDDLSSHYTSVKVSLPCGHEARFVIKPESSSELHDPNWVKDSFSIIETMQRNMIKNHRCELLSDLNPSGSIMHYSVSDEDRLRLADSGV